VNLESLLARLRAATAALSGVQLATLAVTFVAVVGLVVGSAYWVNAPTWAVLFSDMDTESAGGVVTRLKNDKVPFTLDDGGRTIRVPASRVDELRLDFASQGMPASGRIGFEIFDRTAFGVTDFLEHVNYRRALEGELARTIGTIAEVRSARVHIAMPRPSLFAGQDQAAKASVVLKLRNNRPLAASTITAISGLVASSVEALRPEAVVIMDTFGRPLARAPDGSDEAAGGLHIEQQQRIEHELSARVVSLLEPIVGAERVRVNVNAKLNPDSQEETEERWDPTPVVRSHQSTNQNGGPAATQQGVAGARANMPVDQSAKAPGLPGQTGPPGPAAAATPVTGGAERTSETTNYEVSRLTRHRIQPRGQIARLSVAVLLDNDHPIVRDKANAAKRQTKPRSPEEIQKIHDVVAASVGLDTERGDQLTVENIAFEDLAIDDGPAPEPWWKRTVQSSPSAPNVLLDVSRIGGMVLIVLLVVFGVVRPVVRGTLGPAALVKTPAKSSSVAESQAPRTVAEMEGEMDAQLDSELPDGQARRLPALTRRVAKLTQAEPENAARLLRSWLSEDSR
jgi:flagellar M-ring protein FliF